MTHTSSFFASWERLGNRITPRESYPINFLLALLDGASIADIRVCVQREYISNGHRRDSRALCANLQRSQRTRSYRPRRSPATRSTRFTIQPVIRLLFIRALSLSLSLSLRYTRRFLVSFARVPRIFVPFSEMARAQLRFPGNFGGPALLAVPTR